MSNSIIDLHLPYQTQSDITFIKEATDSSKKAVSITNKMKEFTAQNADEILRALVGNASAIPGYLAACLIVAGIDSYDFQEAVVQLEEGFFVRQKWNNVSKSSLIEKDVKIDLDFREELEQLRHENWILRSAENSKNRNIDRKSGMQGRYVTLYIAAGLESEWLMCPNLLLNGEYSNNSLNRILHTMGDLGEKVVLV